MLKDIIFSGITWRDKSRTIDVNYSHGVINIIKDKVHQAMGRLMVADSPNEDYDFANGKILGSKLSFGNFVERYTLKKLTVDAKK